MKRNIIIFSLLLTAFLCFAYSKPAKSEKNMDTLTGMINVYGNEPFTFIGIDTDDEKKYTIKADEETIKALRKTQGHKIEIKGTIDKDEKSNFNRLKDGYFIVVEWKEIK